MKSHPYFPYITYVIKDSQSLVEPFHASGKHENMILISAHFRRKHVFAVPDGLGERAIRCLVPTWKSKEPYILCLLRDASGSKRREIRCSFPLILQVRGSTYDLNCFELLDAAKNEGREIISWFPYRKTHTV